MTAVLEAIGMEKRFPVKQQMLLRRRDTFQALQGIDLALYSGQTLGVVGESGSGKSTLGEIFGDLQQPTSGIVRYKGQDIRLTPWYREHVSPKFVADRNQLMAILNQESSLMEIVKLIGSDVLPDDQKLTLEIARVIRLGFLQQNAFHAEDTCVPMEKQFKMMETILYLYEKCRALINRGMPVSVLKEGNNIFEKIISIKYDVANNQLDKFDQYKQDIDTFYDNIMEKNG